MLRTAGELTRPATPAAWNLRAGVTCEHADGTRELTKTIPTAPPRGTSANTTRRGTRHLRHDTRVCSAPLYAFRASASSSPGFAVVSSLVLAVGDVFVDNTPGDATETAIRTLGTNDKPFLLTTIVVASLLFGAVIGVTSRRQRRKVLFSLAGFGVIGG